MLCKVKSISGYKLASLDGDIGTIKEFYFDDHHWAIRYLVADTGTWLVDRQVLISPYALIAVLEDTQQIAINLTKKQIENSPPAEKDKPVSKQFEDAYNGYFGWPMYYGGPHMWGSSPHLVRDPNEWKKTAQEKKTWDLNLRSTKEVSEYYIHATDGEIGHVEDFIFDDEIWAIRFLIVDTRNWWPGKKVLISPQWIERISWDVSKVFLNLTREAVKGSPEYTGEINLTRDYELRLHKHYNRPGYWQEKQAPTGK